MAGQPKRVAVIGAGPAGAIATDALVKEQAFETIRVFDRRPVAGGTWVYTPHLPPAVPSLPKLLANEADEPVELPLRFPAETPKSEAVNGHQSRYADTALHTHLHSNIVPSIMSYSQEPFPDTLTDRLRDQYGHQGPFRHHSVIRKWVEDIFVRGGHEKLLVLNTTVERAEKRGGEWVLTLRQEQPASNYWWQETFDALVVATGHYNIPFFPEIQGLVAYNDRFPGRVIHSKHFRSADKFAGKKVIVVGGSVSAHEIVHEILLVAHHPVYASLRGPPIPVFGLTPFEHPHVQIKKEIIQFDAQSGHITFADGSVLEDVDYVVFGTSYNFSIPFLPHVQDRIKRANRRLPGVYQHTFDIEDASLAFVGFLGGGFTFRAYEYQAVAVARRLAGRGNPLPSADEQRAWERQRVAELGGGKSYYSIGPNYKQYLEFLRHVAGEPAPGTTGRVLQPFDDRWLDEWAKLPLTKIKRWKEVAEAARKEEAETVLKAKL
ncbi:thiol-specific monooxygenase [Niveomyces insectorum RCEF 264]|uniref:Thiol-specific monooxygenase n=1 Tax=Niveomyces insectorum RCEF 264 TaxID=1081102 RepID=A0A167YTJ9_9HYPO|nr:thiol-specific monooxygenase [Niveomyces insectorum RCEF 264]